MPELPEVESSRAHVEKFCLGSTIVNCHATEQGGGPRDGQFDELVIGEGVTAPSLTSTLEGRTIVALKRRGKQMWFMLDKPPHPLFHFGMTGAFTIKGEKRYKFIKFKVGEGWPPRFTKLELQMSNGACLALTDPRRLARVRLRTDPEDSPPISLLGPDPLTHPLSLEAFAIALAKATAPIKAVLLAQDRVVSGVGNWVADEVCFQARVHPGAPCNTLSPEQVKTTAFSNGEIYTTVAALHTMVFSVCREACEARADYTLFPAEWLFHHRWNKGKASDGAPRVSSGHPIHFDVVGGRTTAFVPALQRKGLLSAGSSARTTTAPSIPGKAKPKNKSRAKRNAAETEEAQQAGEAIPLQQSAVRGGGHVGKKARTIPKSESADNAKQKVRKLSPSNANSTPATSEPAKAKNTPPPRKAPKPPSRAVLKAVSKASRSDPKSEALSTATAAVGSKKRTRGKDVKATDAARVKQGKRAKSADGAKVEERPAAAASARHGASKRTVGRRSSRLAS